MLSRAPSSGSLLSLRALPGFLSDSWMPVFVQIKGTECLKTAAALSNQGEISQQMLTSWSDTQGTAENPSEIAPTGILPFYMNVGPEVGRQLTE